MNRDALEPLWDSDCFSAILGFEPIGAEAEHPGVTSAGDSRSSQAMHGAKTLQ